MKTNQNNLSILYRSEHLNLANSFELKIAKIKQNFESIFHKKGQVIFSEGNIPKGLFYVESGKIKIYKYGSDGKEQIIRIAKKGDFLGYKNLLTGNCYNASATVIEDAILTYIPKTDFQNLFKNDADFADMLTQLLCYDLTDMEEKVVSIAYKPVRGRLAETLLELIEVYKENEESSDNAIVLSRDDLAKLIGTAKETLIRLLTEFKTEKLIRSDGKAIWVLDPVRLMKIDNLYN
ncbi:Crp/Fnr family transcriptional regulator [Fulvivirgaceae bacterium BMA10]|uniref:Crp/Fnr family transcriptional regulator n=1 Tax=Splendidivirga corallicola TaxID=3051826 RepID=A0ABT8KWW1_9BACT|nr:Crp/Fnr family transcriptional regulator [Fulvivirgaceae bacterium BMA10]